MRLPFFCLYLFVYNSDSEPLLIIYRHEIAGRLMARGKKSPRKEWEGQDIKSKKGSTDQAITVVTAV